MANVELTFKDKNLLKFLRNTQKAHKLIREYRKEYVVLVSAIVFNDIIEHFTAQRGPKGKWKKWSMAYKSFLAKHNPSHLSDGLILQDKGTLRKGFRPIEAGKGWRKKSKGILWFNPVPHARIHDEGGSSTWKGRKVTIPQRSFMWLSNRAIVDIEMQTLDFLGV